jgi:citrate lyase beta subunit
MIKPYHYTKGIGKDFVSFFEKVIACNGIVCFDFEDSIGSSDQYENTFLKNSHRKSIIQKLKNWSSPIDLRKIGFRINGTETLNYDLDIEGISDLKSLNCVFLPKVECITQVEKFLHDVPTSVQEIIPIIETKKGFENLAEILSIRNDRFLRIAFGHCDFNLSNKYFPFFHQNSTQYWDWISTLAVLAEFADKQIINSPVLDLANGKYFSQVLKKTKDFKNLTGQITLCLNQTFLCGASILHAESDLLSEIETHNCKLDLAYQIVTKFENYKVEDRFFAIDESRILISPQEYKQAKIIIESMAL